jgi:hypothetical protein
MFFDKIEFIYLVFNAFIAGICLEMTVRTPLAAMIGPPVSATTPYFTQQFRLNKQFIVHSWLSLAL